ncbi:uncharacterized protein LOC100846370 [Brachypodium distachyon]|uniref:VQ domain-containing protein n=1 Tax=Brachypodium distachyon TaxID=15368 RepID=I1H619_BRADI|nr:uncharacterized protein LOC100846370 [Brachypodium distachyon]KQK21923.1 hypothetical protein BRADI_1g63980v3 [Brachypodium distachyon]|eukprot:XP_003561684.1 uncharacterized protein LOC100846370 [Brachypodium distachyon]
MDAVACAAPPASLLSRSFADAAIARALSFSVSGCSPDPDHQSVFACSTAAATAPAPALICEPPSARCRQQQQLGPAPGGRTGKRRPRPSKRAPTTYISTDAATFRLMVQHVTGADADTLQISSQDAGAGLQVMPPPFDVGSLLPSSVDPAAAYVLPPAPPAAVDQPCFPTLDSWNVMYGKNEAI